MCDVVDHLWRAIASGNCLSTQFEKVVDMARILNKSGCLIGDEGRQQIAQESVLGFKIIRVSLFKKQDCGIDVAFLADKSLEFIKHVRGGPLATTPGPPA